MKLRRTRHGGGGGGVSGVGTLGEVEEVGRGSGRRGSERETRPTQGDVDKMTAAV